VVPDVGDNAPAAPWRTPVSPILGLQRVDLGQLLNRWRESERYSGRTAPRPSPLNSIFYFPN
jgi:hypothetical protein